MTQISDQDFNEKADQIERELREKSTVFTSKLQTFATNIGSEFAKADKALEDFRKGLDIDPDDEPVQESH